MKNSNLITINNVQFKNFISNANSTIQKKSAIFIFKYKIFISVIFSFIICFLYYKSTINQKLEPFTKFGIPEALSIFGILAAIFCISISIFPNIKKLSLRIFFYAISSSVFSIFLSNIFSQFIQKNLDIYLHYISRFSFDLMLYLTTCSILEIELRDRKLFKNLFYVHIFALSIITILLPLSYINLFHDFINENNPIFITKHLLFPIKFIPYFFGLYFTYKKIKNSKNILFIYLLIAYILGLIGQTYDELMYFYLIKRGTYSVLYYAYIFLFVFIIIILHYNRVMVNNIKKYKYTYDIMSGSFYHESQKYLLSIHDAFYKLHEKNIISDDEIEKNEFKFNIAYEIISHYVSSVKDIKDSYDYLSPIKIDLIQYIKIVIENIEIKDKIQIKYQIISDSDCILIYSDRKKIMITIENIIKNAVEHSSPNLDLTIKINKNIKSNSVSIDFENNGSVNESFSKSIFKSVVSTKLDPSNNGLGLHIAKSAIESVGGSISLKRNKNPVVFSILIPISISEDVREIK